jgi:hypothetical protein
VIGRLESTLLQLHLCPHESAISYGGCVNELPELRCAVPACECWSTPGASSRWSVMALHRSGRLANICPGRTWTMEGLLGILGLTLILFLLVGAVGYIVFPKTE